MSDSQSHEPSQPLPSDVPEDSSATDPGTEESPGAEEVVEDDQPAAASSAEDEDRESRNEEGEEGDDEEESAGFFDPEVPERADKLLLALVLLFAGMCSLHKITSPDVWWHLKTGEVISQQRTIPKTDLFGATSVGREWINLSWLSDVVAYQLNSVIGLSGLIIAKTLIVVAFTWILLSMRRGGGSYWWAVAVLGIAIFGMRGRFLVRPEVLSYLWLCVLWWALYQYKCFQRRALLWIIPPLMLLWVNTHGLFVLGLLVLVLFLVGELLQPMLPGALRKREESTELDSSQLTRVGVVLVTSLAVCFVNPYGWNAWKLPAELVTKTASSLMSAASSLMSLVSDKVPLASDYASYHQRIEELRSPIAIIQQGSWGVREIALAVMLLGGLISFCVNYRRFNLARFLWFLAFTALGLMAVRNVALACMAAAVCLIWNGYELLMDRPRKPTRDEDEAEEGGGAVWGRVGRQLTAAGLLGAVFLACTNRIPPVQAGEFGLQPSPVLHGLFAEEAAEWLAKTPVTGNTFTMRLGQAAMVLFQAGPDRKVYLDGRLEVYDELFFNYYDMRRWVRDDDVSNWRPEFDRYNITHVVVGMDTQRTLSNLFESPNWMPVKITSDAAVFLRKDREEENQAWLKEESLDLVKLNWLPDKDQQITPDRLGLTSEEQPIPRRTSWITRVLNNRLPPPPGLGIARLYALADKFFAALRETRRALAEDPSQADGFALLGRTYSTLGQLEKTATTDPLRDMQMLTAFRQATVCDPNNLAARLSLFHAYLERQHFDLAREQLEYILSSSLARRLIAPEEWQKYTNSRDELHRQVQFVLEQRELRLAEFSAGPELFADYCQRMGCTGMALEYFEEANQSGRLQPGQLLFVARLCLDTGQPLKAVPLIGRLQNVGGLPAGELEELAGVTALLLTGQYRGTLESWAQVNQSQFQIIGQSLQQGLGQLVGGNLQGAYDQSSIAANLADRIAERFYHMGLLLLEVGASKEAVRAFRRALELNPDMVYKPVMEGYIASVEAVAGPIPTAEEEEAKAEAEKKAKEEAAKEAGESKDGEADKDKQADKPAEAATETPTDTSATPAKSEQKKKAD